MEIPDLEKIMKLIKVLLFMTLFCVGILFAQTSQSIADDSWVEHAKIIVYVLAALVSALVSMTWWMVKKFTDARLLWETRIERKMENHSERLGRLEAQLEIIHKDTQ